MNIAKVYLKKDEDRRIRAGHLWIFSNEIDTHKTPLQQFEPGQLVQLTSYQNKPLGIAYINPKSLICARILTNSAEVDITELLSVNLQRAFSLRESLFAKPYYRMVYGESDWLPGLIVERFNDILVVQTNTAGMENLKHTIIEILIKVLKPNGILLKNDTKYRDLEGLDNYIECVHGHVPEWIQLEEHYTLFNVPIEQGQKTGWFFDHATNRRALAALSKGKVVLDVFSYLGAWGLQCAKQGAKQVTCIDSSESATQRITQNAKLNSVAEILQCIRGDAFEKLKELDGHDFDIVILDPPAFITRKKDLAVGCEAYQRLNQLALKCLKNAGVLVSASCSSHIDSTAFKDIIRRAGQKNNQEIQLIYEGTQSPDHPIHPAIPETQYLKCYFAKVYK